MRAVRAPRGAGVDSAGSAQHVKRYGGPVPPTMRIAALLEGLRPSYQLPATPGA